MSTRREASESSFWGDVDDGEALRRYRQLVNMVDDGIYQLDAEGRFVAVNDIIVEMTGYDRDSLLGEPVSRILDEEDTARIEREIQRRLTAGDVRNETLEFEVRTVEGRTIVCEQKMSLLVEGGTFQGTVGIVRDITSRKRREELREREAKFRQIAENLEAVIWLTPPGKCEMTYVNPAYEEIWGRSRESLYEDPTLFLEAIHPDDRDRVEAALDHQPEGEYDEEFRVVRPDGTIRWVRDRAFPIEDENEDVYRIVGIAEDITERRAHKRDLEESEHRYRTLVENFPNGAVALVDEDLRFQTVGGQPQNSANGLLDGLENVPIEEALRPEIAAEVVPRYEAALGGAASTIETRFGDDWFRFQFVPVRDDDDEVFAALGMSQDITEQKEREQYLADAKAQLEAATEAGTVGTWEWQIREDRMSTCPSFARLFDVDPEAAREGVSIDQFISSVHEADRERVKRQIEEIVESGGEYEAEYRVWNENDELQWVVARGHVECDEGGTPVTFLGALTDITERKRAEQELQRTKKQLETLIEAFPVGVVVADEDGTFTRANDVAEEIWGGGILDTESVTEYDKYAGWWADSGEPVEPDEWTMSRVLEGEEITEPDVFEIEAADGTQRTIESRGMPIRNVDGEVVKGVVAQSDITERREFQRKLETSERRHRTLVENYPNGAVVLFDENLEYTAAGGQYFEKTGVSPDERIGYSIYEVYPDDLVEKVEPKFRAALEGEQSEFEVEFNDRDLRISTVPVRNANGDIYAGMLVSQDVTGQREYQRKLEESNERLEQFAYAVSHDLQEPLRMISSYLQLIERRYASELDEDGREFLAFAVDGAKRMRAMIEGLLEYSRVETRGDPFESVELGRIFEDVCEDLQIKVEESAAEITAEALPRVEGDDSQLRQVFQNLLDNAIEYSGDESPRIDVSAERIGSEWRISVCDEGIGLDPDDQERIFEVFQRLHTHDEHPGTGIGLALCQRIVERHGGEIWVDSEPGEGATFSFTVPAANDQSA